MNAFRNMFSKSVAQLNAANIEVTILLLWWCYRHCLTLGLDDMGKLRMELFLQMTLSVWTENKNRRPKKGQQNAKFLPRVVSRKEDGQDLYQLDQLKEVEDLSHASQLTPRCGPVCLSWWWMTAAVLTSTKSCLRILKWNNRNRDVKFTVLA